MTASTICDDDVFAPELGLLDKCPRCSAALRSTARNDARSGPHLR
jgi:hypothetical protein